MTGLRFYRQRPALPAGIALFTSRTAPQPDRAARSRQIVRLRLAFALTPAQAALVASLAFGERGAE